jgi:hypothetical protein
METETGQNTPSSAERVLEVARQQKRLIWLILLQIISAIILISMGLDESPLGLLIGAIVIIICLYVVYKMGLALELSTGQLVITIIVLLVPILSIFALLYINNKATKFLRAAGVQVGFMGAKRNSLGAALELD